MSGIEESGEILKDALLETLVPHASKLDIEAAITAALEAGADDLPAVLSSIPQREILFFDESLPVRIVLRLSDCSESSLERLLGRLQVRLDAFVVESAHNSTENGPPTRDQIYSVVVSKEEEPLIVVNTFEDDAGEGQHVYAIWNLAVFLRRPRMRIQQPSLMFLASVNLTPPGRSQQRSHDDDYLPELIPASSNMLEPLSNDKTLDEQDPFLPASRLLRVIPSTHAEEPSYNIQQQTSSPIRVVAAANARIRYSRLNNYSGRPITVASLDFEVAPSVTCEVALDKAQLHLSDGAVEPLADVPEASNPIICRPRDDVTLVHRLTPEYGPDPNPTTTSMISTLDISLSAVIRLSEDCNPRINMDWRTHVDFSVALNPTFGGPSPALQRSNRPTSLSMTANSLTNANGVPHSARSSLRERAYSITDGGVSISFSGPHSVEIGKPFTWDVFVVNRSMVPRKFALVAIPRRKRADLRKHAARPSSSSVTSRKEDVVAEAVSDDNILHAMQKSAAGQEAELISLSTDIRIGPLLPGTCHSTELRLLPLAAGSLHLEAIRIVDVDTNETTDIRDLPDIVALNSQGNAIGVAG